MRKVGHVLVKEKYSLPYRTHPSNYWFMTLLCHDLVTWNSSVSGLLLNRIMAASKQNYLCLSSIK